MIARRRWSSIKSNFFFVFFFPSVVSFLLRRCAVRATEGTWIDLTFKPVQEWKRRRSDFLRSLVGESSSVDAVRFFPFCYSNLFSCYCTCWSSLTWHCKCILCSAIVALSRKEKQRDVYAPSLSLSRARAGKRDIIESCCVCLQVEEREWVLMC